MIENRAVDIKSRELYEAPAALTLIEAQRALEDLVLTKGEVEVGRPKRPVFDARREVRQALAAPRVLVAGLELDRETLATAAGDPQLAATDAAEALVAAGTPFRTAHESVATQVRGGRFEPSGEPPARRAPGPAAVAEAAEAARSRLGARPLP